LLYGILTISAELFRKIHISDTKKFVKEFGPSECAVHCHIKKSLKCGDLFLVNEQYSKLSVDEYFPTDC